MDYYKENIEKTIEILDSTKNGLSQTEAKQKQHTHGLNKIRTDVKINKLKLFIGQFKSFIIYILLFAVVFSLLLQEFIDAIIILIILLLNAFIGYYQELSAKKSLNALKQLNKIEAKVYRDGRVIEINSIHLVPGDVIVLEAGDKVPADCRLIEARKLKVNESALTGESLPIEKEVHIIDKEVPLGDRKNMVFSSTNIVEGSAKAIVVETGMKTEIGKITSMIRDTEDDMTPLQKRLDSFGRKLTYVIIGICLVVFILSGLREYFTNGMNLSVLLHILLIAVSLAVAAVPTALPAVVTIALSVGVKKLLKKKALVMKLSSVETLGSCDIICTDKTGTLTQNEMTVKYAWSLEGLAEIEGVGYNPDGHISKKLNPMLYEIGLNCNNSSLVKEKGIWEIAGDPTEGALVVSARKNKLSKYNLKIDEIPFDSKRKLMSVLFEKNNKKIMYTKGAPDQLLKCCTHVLKNGKKVKITKEIKIQIEEKNIEFASNALRVLAFAYKDVSKSADFKEKDLVFVGLQAMIDPPRGDVIKSIKKTRDAGIRVIMITGDYPSTAKAIASQVGIEGEVISGDELDEMNEKQLEQALDNETNIFARVSPKHKQRIVGCLQSQGHVVAMTGDGVNDAPALKKANIGVAVGSGTDVAKEAADFVLLDDSFSNIVNAVEEGRGIYDNIQKSIMLLLSGNLGEVLIIFFAVLFGFNLPLTAILLLWINLITDGAPALAYSVDGYSKGIMQRPPLRQKGVLPKSKYLLILVLGAVGSAIGLYLFYLFGGNGENHKLAQTFVFNFLVFYELVLAFIIRQSYGVKFFSNLWLWIAILFSFGMQFVIMYVPFMAEIFDIVPLGAFGLITLLFAGTLFYLYAILIQKFYFEGKNSSR
ncbi:MAG: cation-translocating P-type ATPase [Nanoarchaeota archaeon]